MEYKKTYPLQPPLSLAYFEPPTQLGQLVPAKNPPATLYAVANLRAGSIELPAGSVSIVALLTMAHNLGRDFGQYLGHAWDAQNRPDADDVLPNAGDLIPNE